MRQKQSLFVNLTLTMVLVLGALIVRAEEPNLFSQDKLSIRFTAQNGGYRASNVAEFLDSDRTWKPIWVVHGEPPDAAVQGSEQAGLLHLAQFCPGAPCEGPQPLPYPPVSAPVPPIGGLPGPYPPVVLPLPPSVVYVPQTTFYPFVSGWGFPSAGWSTPYYDFYNWN
jgi:hypothetical protein